jgi:cytochrome P450
MVEGVLILARLLRDFEVETVAGRDPVPVAHLTVRAHDGIWLNLRKRQR